MLHSFTPSRVSVSHCRELQSPAAPYGAAMHAVIATTLACMHRLAEIDMTECAILLSRP